MLSVHYVTLHIDWNVYEDNVIFNQTLIPWVNWELLKVFFFLRVSTLCTVRLQLTIVFMINPLITIKGHKIVKNVHHSFPNPKVTSSNILSPVHNPKI